MEYTIRKTKAFDKWLRKLKNPIAKAKLLTRITIIEEEGHFGDTTICKTPKSIDIRELREFTGAGYRVYYTIRNDIVVFLLAGGIKDTQSDDIQKAINEFNKL